MYDLLVKICQSHLEVDFMLPGQTEAVKGTITAIRPDYVEIVSTYDGRPCEYVLHPNGVCLVQGK